MNNIDVQIAKAIVSRAEAQGLKGKKRDDMALEFALGAQHAQQVIAELAGEQSSPSPFAFLIACRGWEMVLKYAAKPLQIAA